MTRDRDVVESTFDHADLSIEAIEPTFDADLWPAEGLEDTSPLHDPFDRAWDAAGNWETDTSISHSSRYLEASPTLTDETATVVECLMQLQATVEAPDLLGRSWRISFMSELAALSAAFGCEPGPKFAMPELYPSQDSSGAPYLNQWRLQIAASLDLLLSKVERPTAVDGLWCALLDARELTNEVWRYCSEIEALTETKEQNPSHD